MLASASAGPLFAIGTRQRRGYGEVRQGCWQTGREHDAAPQEGDAEERFRTQGEEPEAGDRHRSLRGAIEGRQGAEAEERAKDLAEEDGAEEDGEEEVGRPPRQPSFRTAGVRPAVRVGAARRGAVSP